MNNIQVDKRVICRICRERTDHKIKGRYRLTKTEIINHLFHYNLLIIIPIIYCIILLYISFNL